RLRAALAAPRRQELIEVTARHRLGKRANPLPHDRAAAIDEEGLREAGNAVIDRSGVPFGDSGRIRDGKSRGEPARLLLGIPGIHAEKDDPLLLVFRPEPRQYRRLVAARRAPRGPEVDHHWPASQVREP